MAFDAPATAPPGPFASYQQPHSEPPTPAYHHSVGLGERIPFSSPPLTLADLTPPRCPASPLWAPRSPKEVNGLGPNVPGQRTLPPAPTSLYMHRPRVSIAEAIRLRMDFDDMRISPVPTEDQDYDMRGPGMEDMDVDQVDFKDSMIPPVPAEDEDHDMRGPGMGDMDVDQQVVIAQDVEMSSAVMFGEDVVPRRLSRAAGPATATGTAERATFGAGTGGERREGTGWWDTRVEQTSGGGSVVLVLLAQTEEAATHGGT
ncbi:hypothetical protein FRC10_004824 [Ceratobasidium sp. 414]|nr:hypothetical protein FRC10_004824 [Ceratobasidium sp. 414]